MIRLYAGRLKINDKVVASTVKKTQGASAVFIKELMRRSARFMVRSGGATELQARQVEDALDEMLFSALQDLGGNLVF